MGLFRRFISFLRHPEFNSGSLLKKNFTPLQVKKTIQYPSFYARVKDIFSLTRFRKNKINNPKLIAILLGGIFFAFLGGIIYRNQISTFFSSAGADPVSYWKFDEGQGSTAYDSTGSSDGTLGSGNSAPTWVSEDQCISGKCLRFDGSGDYIVISQPSIETNPNEFTISGWIKPGNISGYFISPTSVGYDQYLRYDASNSTIGVAIAEATDTNNRTRYSTDNSVPQNSWTYWAVTIDGLDIKIYINGQLNSEYTESISIAGWTSNWVIGARGNRTNWFNGYLDELKVYSYVRSAAQIKADYTSRGSMKGVSASFGEDGFSKNLSDGLVGYWKMDEGSGTSTIDSSGVGNNGTFGAGNSAPTWTQGKFGKAVSFDGSNDYVSITEGSDLGFFTKSTTVCLWVNRLSTSSAQRFFSVRSGSPRESFELLTEATNDKVRLDLGDGTNAATLVGNRDISKNVWTHICGVRDLINTKSLLYVNGALDNSANLSITGDINPTQMRIGNFSTSYMNGSIDDVKIYNYARTQEQIIQDMNAGHPAVGTPVGSTVLHLKMDEGYGTTVHDSSPQKNNGTIAGSSAPTWTTDGKFGKALSFDGVNDYVQLSSTSSLTFTDMTLSVWIKSNTPTSNKRIISTYHGANPNNFYSLNTSSDGLITFNFRDADDNMVTVTSTQTLQTDKWYHVAGIREAGNYARIFINGVEDSSAVDITGVAPIGPNSTVRIGWDPLRSSGQAFNGLIDEVKIYPFALTADQVKVDFNQGKTQVLGAGSSGVGGTSPSNSASREYCIPGDTSTCNAPVGEWLFEEGSGSSANDSSGNGNSGNLLGGSAPSWTDGKFGKALKFDGVNDFVQIQDSSSLNYTSAPFTISSWVKKNISTSSYIRVYDKAEANTSNGYGLDLRDTGIRILGSTNYVVSYTVNNDTWYHIVAVYDGDSNGKIYVNGLLVGSGTYAANNAYNGTAQIGKSSTTSSYFNGIIDQVRIYDYARTPAQIAWEYNRGAPVAYYKFDECTGTTIYDSSGNKLNGTLDLGSNGVTSEGTCVTTGAWASGAQGKKESSLSFDGTDDYVSIPDNPLLSPGTGDYTVSAFVKTTKDYSSVGWIYSNYGSTSNNLVGLVVNTNETIQCSFRDGSANTAPVAGTIVINDGMWHHVLCMKDDNQTKLFVDGVADGTTDASALGTINTAGRAKTVGTFGTTPGLQNFQGQIDDVKIYNYALTPQQIQTEMAGGAVRFE